MRKLYAINITTNATSSFVKKTKVLSGVLKKKKILKVRKRYKLVLSNNSVLIFFILF